jgi:Spy/CpxP family protein refolding chaperone
MLASRSTLLSALGALAAAFLLPGMAAAQVTLGPRVGPGLPEVRLVERNAERLELDEKAIAAVQELATQASAGEEKLSGQVRDQRLKLRDLLNEELPDEAALLKQLDVVNRLSGDLQKQQLQTSLRLRKLLTPEQRKELMELRKNVRQQRRRRPPR